MLRTPTGGRGGDVLVTGMGGGGSEKRKTDMHITGVFVTISILLMFYRIFFRFEEI